MPVFKDQDNKDFVLLPPGDYVFRVESMECGISTGSKTAGSPFWEFELAIEDPRGGVVFERLTDHSLCSWKIDTFLKSTNAAPPKGTAFDFSQEAAESAGCVWVDPIGLRGHCQLTVEEYKKVFSTEKYKNNKVAVFLTNKPKLPRAERPKQEEPPIASAPTSEPETDDLPF